jgi:hypothetical protein
VYDAGDGAAAIEKCGIPGPYLSQNQQGSTDRDNWQAWWLDFFQPAAPAFAVAPWVFARGNHELCSHAGPGWLYFLGPGSTLASGGGKQHACPDQDGEGPALPHLHFVEPYQLALGDLNLLVVDSANACDALPGFTDIYTAQFESLSEGIGDDGSHWLMSHRPTWGVEGDPNDPDVGCDGKPGGAQKQPNGTMNVTLQCALAGDAGKAFLKKLDLTLAGHMHRFQRLAFPATANRPLQYIVGNSGVDEGNYPPEGKFAQLVDGYQATGFAVSSFGFLELQRIDGSWREVVVALEPAAWQDQLKPCGQTDGNELCVESLAEG